MNTETASKQDENVLNQNTATKSFLLQILFWAYVPDHSPDHASCIVAHENVQPCPREKEEPDQQQPFQAQSMGLWR